MPIPTPNKDEMKDAFISRFMSNEDMKKEYPEEKQRVAIAHSQWRKKHGGEKPKELLFCNVVGFETKEDKSGNLIKSGYIATTHLDSGFYDDKREIYVQDKIAKETLDTWTLDINEGKPISNKVSIHHDRKPHVAGVGIKGTARVDKFTDGEYGLYVDTLIDKTREDFEDTKYRIDSGLIDSYSIEFATRNPITEEYIPGAVKEIQNGEGIIRQLLPNTQLKGWTLASQPMNEHAIMFKEIKIENDAEKSNQNKKEGTMPEPTIEKKEYSEEDKLLLKEAREKKELETKEKIKSEMKEGILKEIKEELSKALIENKVLKNKEELVETKEVIEYKEIINGKCKKSVVQQFQIAGRIAEAKGMFKPKSWETKMAEDRRYEHFSTNGNFLEFKGLGITTNQNSDTDYLLSAAELDDVFDPVIYNAINQKTITWNLLAKDDYSMKGNNQVQFKLKTATNTSATAYLGNAVSTGVVTRLKYETKFKKYQVGVEVDGDMIASARGGPIGDVFAQEVRDSTDDLMSLINFELFVEVGAETAAGIIGFEYIADSAGNTTLYNLTRSAANKLSPATAGDTYINGASADLSVTNLRAALRQAIKEGANINNLFFVGNEVQGDKLKSIYDAAQRLYPVSARFGFEGAITFDGIPFFVDKDCTSGQVYLIDQETHRIAMWVPPTLEMLGKDADSQKGFIKTYFATYNRAPRRLCVIYSNAT